MTKKSQKNHLKADKHEPTHGLAARARGGVSSITGSDHGKWVSPGTTQDSETICRELQLVLGSQYEPDINNMQWVQRRATKMLKELELLPCEGQVHSTRRSEKTL